MSETKTQLLQEAAAAATPQEALAKALRGLKAMRDAERQQQLTERHRQLQLQRQQAAKRTPFGIA